MHRFTNLLSWNPAEWLAAVFISAMGYLSPIKNIAHMMLFLFFLDIIYGWLAARKLRNEKFRPAIIWKKTVPRIMLSIVLLIGAFMLDKETGQDFISIYRILGWFISALLLFSITKNGYIVTNWDAIPLIGKFIENKIEQQTGVELPDENP